ncbi:MAG TPA: ubiquinol-cytochrome C reductase, partial [Porticoccaceae bacterium]|nr:ubiquinol-cytochrome C reductase [Porticoccaceae bacterium]
HDLVPVVVFLFVFCFIIFFMPEMGGYFLEFANFEHANPLKTPEHIAPVWYFTPFYSMLRAVTVEIGPLNAKFLGFLAMAAAVAILFTLPWLDRSKEKSFRYRGKLTAVMIGFFAASFIILGVLGVKAPSDNRTLLAQITMVYYFAFFLTMPVWSIKANGVKPLRYIITGVFGLGFIALSLPAEGKQFSWFIQLIAVIAGLFFFALPALVERNVCKPEPERITMDGGMGFWRSLALLLIVLGMAIVPLKAAGAESAYDCGTIPCDEFKADASDKESLQHGAKLFVNYCMGCHSAKYSRWERVADDLNIPHELALENLVFSGQKIGGLMEISMSEKSAKDWFGAPPPDLTLVTRARQPEWVYTYLRNFYADDSRPFGVNNKVFKNVGMPHAMLDLQGLPECAPGPVVTSNGGIKVDPLTSEPILGDPCGTYALATEGAMSPPEYDAAVYDLVNFLAYMANPVADESRRIGIYVLLFLVFLLVWVVLLNREYWKDVH